MRPYESKDGIKPVRVLFLDSKTGAGFTSLGHKVSPSLGGRRTVNASLGDILETAAGMNAQMVLVTGGGLRAGQDGRHWATVDTPGWVHGNHWIAGTNVTGRYTSAVDSKRRIDVCLASNWFGSVPVNPEQAFKAWQSLLTYFIQQVEPKMNLMKTPGTTGAHLWGYGLVPKFDPPPLDSYLADLLHSTSGQGHIEHLVAGGYASQHPDCRPLVDPASTPYIKRFTHLDARFAYAAVCKELGVGPIHELNQSDAADLWRESPYAKARYLVNFQVPQDWNHVGILGVREEDNRDGWYYPNRPGARGQTWVDHRELLVAARHGWAIQPLGALQFTEKMRPLDTFAARVVRMRSSIETGYAKGYDPIALDAAMAAMRAILLHGIGRFAMRGRSQMMLTTSLDSVPPDLMGTVTEVGKDQFSYRHWDELPPNDRPYYHPELAAQVWGWARANVLDANTKSGHRTGALHVDPRTLIGIETDALYTTDLPQWAAPESKGGADDGAVGRMRLQGIITGRMRTPVTLEARDALKKKADKADLSTVWEGNTNE